MDMLFGLYLALGSATGAPWALLVDGYGFAAAFAAMAPSQVFAALCITLVGLRRPLRPVPHREQRSSARCSMEPIAHGTIADGYYGP
jgi:hypothetical protein